MWITSAIVYSMVRQMPPKILVAIEPAGAFNPVAQGINDSALPHCLIDVVVVVIGKSLMRQTIGSLSVFPRLDDMPAGVSQDPGYVVVIVRTLPARKRIGDERPHATGQPLTLAPGKSAE
jgi:hypothetical protein